MADIPTFPKRSKHLGETDANRQADVFIAKAGEAAGIHGVPKRSVELGGIEGTRYADVYRAQRGGEQGDALYISDGLPSTPGRSYLLLESGDRLLLE